MIEQIDKIFKDPQYIIDWHLDVAELWLKEYDFDYRIVREDDEYFFVTDDLKSDRLNIEIENNKIVKITNG